MRFEDLKADNISLVVKYKSSLSSWEAKQRNDHIIGIAFSGSELHDLGYKQFSIGENCIYFLNQKDDFYVHTDDSALCHSIHFTTIEPVETDSFCIKLNNTDEIVRLIEKIDRQSKISTNGSHRLFSDFYKLCAVFNDVFSKKYHPCDPRMITAREYIDLNFTEPDCPENACRTSGLSYRHFCSLFKTVFNITPSRYITVKKIQLAKTLLKTPAVSVEEISRLCGFNDVYYFSKVFKSETGITPSAFRHM